MPLPNPSRCIISAPAILAALGLLPFATTALPQSEPRPLGQVPYLNQPQSLLPPSPAATDPADQTTAPTSSNGNAIKQRDEELEAIRAEQKRAIENEAKLKREVEAIG